ncbi:MAG: beta-N-acetylhexosaminidase [Vicinamibacterales bacterium]
MSMRLMRRQVGQLLTAGFAGPSLSVELREIAREFDLGTVVLFKRNVEEPAQVAELSMEAAQLGREMPAWVGVDQEGGRVARLRAPFTEWPPMAVLGRADDPSLPERFATALARELVAVGITLDYAPVVDVLTQPNNPAIGDRAISSDAARVSAIGAVIIETLQREGIAACAKHFPGHGEATVDSHLALPVVEAPPDRLEAVELAPFRAAIAADVAFVMMGHLLVPAVDETSPATLSRTLVSGWLREKLGFTGPILTDDLDMQAIAAGTTIEEIAVKAIAAGCDGLLTCGADHERQVRALEAIIRAMESGALPARTVEDALARHRRVKERFLRGHRATRPTGARRWREIVGSREHLAVAEAIAQFQ